MLFRSGYFCGTYLGIRHGVSAGAMALITSQQPIVVALLAPRLVGERVSARHWLGLLLGVGGAALVITAGGELHFTWTGFGFALLALAGMTTATLWEKRFGRTVHPVGANLVQCAVGLCITAPLAWALEPMHIAFTPGLLVSLAYLALGNSLVAISLLLALVRFGQASRVSALFFLIPPVTALMAYGLLDETLPTMAWPGIALAGLGIYLVMRKPA